MSGKKANGEGSIRKIEDRNVWEARYYIDGKRKSIYAKSKTEARNKMNDILAELRRDEYIDEQKMTLEEWLNIWFDEFLEVRPSSKARYERDIRLRIVPYLGHYRLKDLNTIAIQRMYRKCKSDGLSAKSVMNMHGVLHEALDKAVSLRYMKHNPSDDCTLPKRQKP